jgi:hypothetical protein
MDVSHPLLIVGIVTLAFLVLFNAYVSIRGWTYEGLSKPQKALQIALIWLLPLIGAPLVEFIVFARLPKPKDPGFEPVDRDGTPIGS